MSISTYHHGNLRESLVDAAIQLIRESGHENLTIRGLARLLGVSHNAAYRHFTHRDELLVEVADQAMHGLVEAMQLRLAEVRTPDPVLRARRRLAQSGRGYVDFALAEPGLFRLIFASNTVVAMALSRQHPGPFAVLGEILDDLVEVGFLNIEARIDAEVTCLAAMHGFSMLNIDGPLQTATTRERETSLDQVLIAIDRSYAATSGARVGPHDLRTDQLL